MMSTIYGSQWISWRGVLDDGIWLVGLQPFSPDVVAEVLAMVVENQGGQFHEPPNLPRFQALCYQVTKNNRERAKFNAPPLIEKSVDREIARSEIHKCKQALSGKTTSQN